MSRTRRRDGLLLAGALGLALVPVVLSPVLPTQDGPSHLYNAFLAGRLEAGDPLFTSHLELGPGLWPNRLSHYLLTALGPLLGWSLAERVVAAAATVGPLGGLAFWLRDRTGRIPVLLLAAGLWMAGSWFFWKGFYDFSLSLAAFLGAALVLGRMGGARSAAPGAGAAGGTSGAGGGTPGAAGGSPGAGGGPGWPVHLALQATLALALLAHLFTFAVTLAMVAFALAWHWRRGRLGAVHLAAAVPGAVALGLVVSGGATGGTGMTWYSWDVAAEGLLGADWATAILASDRLAGRAVTALVVAGAFLRLAWREREGEDEGEGAGGGGPSPLEVFGLLAFAGSLLIPARVGTGQYAPERLRLLALLLLTPSAAVALRLLVARLGGGWVRLLPPALGLLLAGAFLFRGLETFRLADRLEADLRSMDRALTAHGAPPGSWITATHWEPFGPFHRIAAYVHVHDRLAVERRLVVLDNYEARMPIFPVRWRRTPDRPEFRRVRFGETLAWHPRVVAGDRPWEDPLLVVHESRFPLVTRRGAGGLETGATTAPASHAVTELLRAPGR